jgi:hypothetical protein
VAHLLTVDALLPRLAPALRARLAAPQLLRPCVTALASPQDFFVRPRFTAAKGVCRTLMAGAAAAGCGVEARVVCNLVELLLLLPPPPADGGGGGVLAAPGALTECVVDACVSTSVGEEMHRDNEVDGDGVLNTVGGVMCRGRYVAALRVLLPPALAWGAAEATLAAAAAEEEGGGGGGRRGSGGVQR